MKMRGPKCVITVFGNYQKSHEDEKLTMVLAAEAIATAEPADMREAIDKDDIIIPRSGSRAPHSSPTKIQRASNSTLQIPSQCFLVVSYNVYAMFLHLAL